MPMVKFRRYSYYALAGCLLATALLLSVVRFWILPRASEWRGELQATISAMIGESVQIKSLSAGMRGFKPELTVRGFRIESADGPPLEFERLGVGVDALGSLVSGHPVVNRISLDGAKLRLTRKPEGEIAVVGMKPGDAPLWLFAEGEVRFSDIDLEWIVGNDAPAMALGRAQARLRNTGDRHTLDVRVDLPGKLGKSLKLSAEVEGNPLGTQEWNGKVYLEAKRLREGAFIESLPVRIRSGEVGLQAWAEWEDGVLSEATGKLDMDRPVFTWRGPDGADGLLNLDNLGGWLFWHKEDQGWGLDVKRLTLSHGGQVWPGTDFSIAIGNAADDQLPSFRAAVKYLRLDEAQALLGTSLPWLDPNLRETLRAFSAKGEVRDARLVYQAGGHFGFCGELDKVSYHPPEGWPKLGQLTGSVCGNDRNGRINIDATQPELNLSGLWQKPIVFDRLKGNFQWRRTGESGLPIFSPQADSPNPWAGSAWRIVGNGIQIAAPGLQADAGFALDLPATEGESPVIDLNAQLRDVNAARLRDYLPLSLMTPNSAQWLGNAFDGGRLKTANVLLRGRLADYPFRQGEGLFEANIDSENMELDFNPGWPHLYDVKANILFFGPSLFIDAAAGRIGNVPFHAVHAETADYVGDGWLGLTGNLDSDLATAMKFLRETPVRYVPDRLTRVADPSGGFHLDLNLLIPMSYGIGDVGVSGLLQLSNDTLALKPINVKIQEINGALGFTNSGMQGSQIVAKALEEAIVFDVDQQNGNILFDITGKAGVPALRKAFPGEFWKHAEGGFGYHLNLKLPESLDSSSKPLHATLSSDLAGLELKLPAPVIKASAEKKDLTAELTMQRGDYYALRIAYGHDGAARLLFSEAGGFHLETGDVSWGKPQARASGEPGLGLYLKASDLDVGEWRTLLADYDLGPAQTVPHELDIQVGRLTWDGDDLGPFYLAGKQEGGELSGEVDCFYGKGSYSATFPEYSHAQIRLELETLNLPKFPEAKEGQAQPNPASLPALQLRAHHLLRQGVDLGELDLDAEHWTSGLNIKRLGLVSDNHQLNLKGGWMRLEGHDQTKLEGRLKVSDLGNFLSQLGYSKEIVRTPTDAAFSLLWGGAPHQFYSATVAGEVKLNMGRGSVLQVDPGLGRALGMLNLNTLRRLLLLDFSDLFGKGLAYDSMEGLFQLGEGQARTKGFMIDAVAAEILVIGRVGLANHDLDQTISVIPHTMASIPLAGAIVGGAAVGAVIDMAHRLVGAEDVNLASTNYAVTGSWDNPQFKRIEGSMPLDMIARAWADFKTMSGMGGKGDSGSE